MAFLRPHALELDPAAIDVVHSLIVAWPEPERRRGAPRSNGSRTAAVRTE
jgi:hypothetical protein